jgi:hypothetical protein
MPFAQICGLSALFGSLTLVAKSRTGLTIAGFCQESLTAPDTNNTTQVNIESTWCLQLQHPAPSFVDDAFIA